MSQPILVDSSWYIHQARLGRDPLRELADVALFREIAVCGMITAEVGRGLRFSKHLERYQQSWNGMLWVEASTEVWNRTLALAWNLDRKGIILPVQDIHIAACAMEVSAVVLTLDQHFHHFPELIVTDCLY
jgi:predicted nucleic acid-binding protein